MWICRNKICKQLAKYATYVAIYFPDGLIVSRVKRSMNLTFVFMSRHHRTEIFIIILMMTIYMREKNIFVTNITVS